MKNRKLIIALKQKGNNIIGTGISDTAKITGILKDETIAFIWIGGPRGWSDVQGVWKINDKGTNLEGTWEAGDGWGGEWNLTKIE